MSPTHQDLSNDTTFSQIKSHVPVPLSVAVVYLCESPEISIGVGPAIARALMAAARTAAL